MNKINQETLSVKRAEQLFDCRRTVGLFGGPLLALLVFFTPIDGLTLEAHKLLSIMVLVAIWWITEPVSIPVTSLIGPTLAVMTGVVPVSMAFAAFANPMIFLFMGGFILAKAMMIHGIDKRFAYWLLSRSWVGSNPRRIFLAIGLAAALCSGWISNTATAAMMFPICLGLLASIKEMFAASGRNIDLYDYKYATGLMLMTAYACSIGGVLTPIGTPPNLIMLGFLDQMCDIHVSFFEWMTWGVIAMVLYFIIAYVMLARMFPADVTKIEGAEQFIQDKLRELGHWTRAQKNTVICFGVSVVLWILPGFLSIALGSTSPVLKMYNRLFPEAVAAMLGALLLSELTSHTAATNMIGPLTITAAISAGMNPVPISVAIALSASLGFMLPVSTPPNAIVYASGYIPITKMIRTGVYIDVIGIACVTIPFCIYFVSWIIG
ncbi:SLC13 family permease [Mitsuokella jalaludinii]|uniref:SLC13 family permease n=2 Tax=Mitsuokella jalaludinii TaxID=187979 RepID=UPI0030776EED